MPDLVTIASYNDPISATFDQHKLEEHGIDSYIADEMTIAMQWTLLNALGGIKLQVSTVDVEEAHRVIGEQVEVQPTEEHPDLGPTELVCPSCGSHSIHSKPISHIFYGILMLLFGTAMPLRPKQRHRCDNCDHTWEA